MGWKRLVIPIILLVLEKSAVWLWNAKQEITEEQYTTKIKKLKKWIRSL